MPTRPPPSDPLARLRAEALRAALGVALGVAACAWWLGAATQPMLAALALLTFALGTVPVIVGLRTHLPRPRFGAANVVTLGRLGAVALLAASIAHLDAAAGWTAFTIATIAALADGVDGPLARAAGLDGPYGARFDMETDAALVMVLAALVWRTDRAGAWVLASGAMRYVFVLAAYMWPWLNAPLPFSQRRRLVCALQIGALLACLAPAVPAHWATAIAAMGLMTLAASFAVDVVGLHRRRRLAPGHPVV
ncbi:MAG: CDP-alcohol phosphatidyltransferase family protein [Burkholderiaceae bacterium]